MKKFILCGVAAITLAAFAGTANAADMSAPASDWAGWYLGGNLGYGHESWTFDFYDNQVPAGGHKTVSDNALIGGLQAGYNWQMNNIVFGLEGDLQASGLKSDQKGGFSFDSCGCFDVSMDYFGTLRAKAGIAVSPDILLYGTGGLIVGDLFYSAADSSPVGSDHNLAPGWIAGLGAEVKMTNDMSVKLEGMYYDFGSPHFNLGDPGFNTDLDVKGYLARVGFNVYF